MIELLAVLSAAAAGGLRIALPLLLIGLLRGDLWSHVPLLSQVHPAVVLGVLVSWSCFELVASKKFLGQRLLQIIQLVLSPVAGGVLALAIAQSTTLEFWTVALLGALGGVVALVLQMVLVGWFFRLQGLPLWFILSQDILCCILVVLALDAPRQGGLVALFLIWLAIRSSQEWRQWYLDQGSRLEKSNPD